jgi:uncharacterized protein (TIGR00369 family)
VGSPTGPSLGVDEKFGSWTIVAKMTAAPKNMDRWLGDGGMAIVAALGAAFEAYGVDGEDLGWASGSFVPSELACNPHGSVQAGVHGVVLDAVMNFAINAALVGRDRTEATIEMTSELLRPAMRDGHYLVRGEVVRLTRQIAYAEASITNDDAQLVSRATATFLVHREAQD